MRRTSLVAILLLLLCAQTAGGTTILVDASGGGDYTNIREGIDAASEGDTVLVAPGLYNGYRNRLLEFGGAGIVLRSTDGPDATVIEADVVTRAFFFSSGEDTTAVVEGFEIVHGYADSGAGVFCVNGSRTKFINCTFMGNGVGGTTYRGGAVCCRESSPVFVGCRFEGNASSDDPLSCGGAVAVVAGSEPRFEDCEFTGNSAAAYGGAVYVIRSNPMIVNCSFVENTAGSGGAGAFAGSEATPWFSNCTFEENTSSRGAGLFSQSAAPICFGCDFLRNAASEGGGGIYVLYPSTTILALCVVAENSAPRGAGIECAGGAHLSAGGCAFVGNLATSGASGIRCTGASANVSRSIVAFGAGGPAVECVDYHYEAELSTTQCVVFGNAGGDSLCGEYADNLFTDPLFCGLSEGDYTLCSNSPCLDGNNPWDMSIGPRGMGCPSCGSPVEQTSWGLIKAIYRARQPRGNR